MSKSDRIKIQMDVEITKRWIPAFIGFINKISHNSRIGHSSLVAFYADGDGDFGFKATIPESENQELVKEFGHNSWDGKLTIDCDKAIGNPVCKDVECPALWCEKIEEVYDAQ